MHLFKTRIRIVLAASAIVAAMGCSSTTGPSAGDIAAHRALWANHHLTRYAYRYRVTGFFISYAGHDIRIVVVGGSVSSATDLTTGQAAPGSPSDWPTIDALFDRALDASSAHALTSMRFDPQFDFPAQMDLAGPPDASGSVFASGLELLP
jgi:uncharacterized protein DUF6174